MKSNVRFMRKLILAGILSAASLMSPAWMLSSAQTPKSSLAPPDVREPRQRFTRDVVAGYIAADQKIVASHGIEEVLPLEINGITQWISIRGKDTRNPVLLYLHGGPGTPFLPISWTVERPWEDYFTVVQWDQRGAGKTYAANDPALVGPTMTIPQMVDDGAELVRFLQEHLHKQKIILVGHSWGSVLGVALAQRHPEWLHAYVGVGQSISARLSEEAGYRFALTQAQLTKNATAEQELEAIAPYPGDLDKLSFDKIGTERKWLMSFGGIAYGRTDQSFEEGVSTLSPAYSQRELEAADVGTMFSISHLIRPLLHVDYTSTTAFRCPIFLFEGRHDYATAHDVAFAWFSTIKAPSKAFIWFENAGHLVPEEEPGRFLLHLVSDVRPLAVKAGDAPPDDLQR